LQDDATFLGCVTWMIAVRGPLTGTARIWPREQHGLAQESTRGTFESVADSAHEIQNAQPQAVVDAVESVLGTVSG
jgi:hypothetical protein